MVEREKQLEQFIMEYSLSTIQSHRQEMEDILTKYQDDITKEILQIFHMLFKKAVETVVDDKSKEVAYIGIDFLNTGILNNSIEMKIGLYSRDLYFDTEPIVAYYNYTYFDDIIKKDIERFNNYIQKKMIRVKYQEMWRYKKVCMMKYKAVMEECMLMYIEMITRLRTFVEMNKTSDFKIMYGELLCNKILLYEVNEEDV